MKFLPGASQIEGMCYNVTLFEQYGWEIPRNTEEFIALCKQIEADTNGEVRAWNPNAKYPNNFFGALQAISYADTLSTADDRLWLNDFVNGKATFAGHMEPFYELIQRIVDEGLLTEDFFTYSATARYNEFMEGKLALYNNYSGDIVGKEGDFKGESSYEFGLFPYPSAQTDEGLLLVTYSYLCGVPIAEMDAAVSGYFDGTVTDPEPEVIASVPENMTILETSEYMADMLRETAGADIALIPNNSIYRGNVMKIFSGDFTEYKLGVIKPRSYTNDAALTKATMTGAQLLELLNIVPYYETTCDAIYAFSGLKATVAPWAPVGEKYVSVTLADGTAIDKDKEYTVAFWAGSVPEQYVTEDAVTYEGTFEELLSAYMKADGEVTAPNDGRITLVWD